MRQNTRIPMPTEQKEKNRQAAVSSLPVESESQAYESSPEVCSLKVPEEETDSRRAADKRISPR